MIYRVVYTGVSGPYYRVLLGVLYYRVILLLVLLTGHVRPRVYYPVFITGVLLLVVLLQPPHSTPPLGYVLLVY